LRAQTGTLTEWRVPRHSVSIPEGIRKRLGAGATVGGAAGERARNRVVGVKFRPPTEFPWGREIHIIDLAGVCWHVRQSGR
jgi:hypothetical protein